MITKQDLFDLIHTRYAYEQNLVSYISAAGEQIYPTLEHTYDGYVARIDRILAEGKSTVKIEQLERYSKELSEWATDQCNKHQHSGPYTIHAFIAPVNGISFPLHIDIQDVLIYVVDGIKDLELHDGSVAVLHPTESILIPAYTNHRAINTHASVMLSLGFESYITELIANELGNIPQNDRNL